VIYTTKAPVPTVPLELRKVAEICLADALTTITPQLIRWTFALFCTNNITTKQYDAMQRKTVQ